MSLNMRFVASFIDLYIYDIYVYEQLRLHLSPYSVTPYFTYAVDDDDNQADTVERWVRYSYFRAYVLMASVMSRGGEVDTSRRRPNFVNGLDWLP